LHSGGDADDVADADAATDSCEKGFQRVDAGRDRFRAGLLLKEAAKRAEDGTELAHLKKAGLKCEVTAEQQNENEGDVPPDEFVDEFKYKK
jgi:hypothetical protein